MCIISSKPNLIFGTIGEATGAKMAPKAVGKNSNFCASVKNTLNMWLGSDARLQNFVVK